MKTYTPTIGLEIHVELKTKTKMFCNSKNDPHAGEPNSHVCPICMGHPGTLPVINASAVEHVLKVGIALNSELATYTEFDRKNYFYPDIPKGYQISQYLYPLVKGGTLNGIQITRVHLEEDTARSLHDQGEGSIIDYNRAGVPLMELVTEPVMHDAKTASNFARELQLLLRTLGVSDANMERGEMRIEANVSVSNSEIKATKYVEVKNINSFKSVEGAIEYEIRRQTEVLEEGGEIVKETRGWDEAKGKTFSQRVKESANDYRYFPDPDLPKLSLNVSRLHENMPELPNSIRERYKNLGLTSEQAEIIISDIQIAQFFDKSLECASDRPDLPKLMANYLLSDLIPKLSSIDALKTANSEHLVALMALVADEKITSRVAKDLLVEAVIEGKDPITMASERGLTQNSSDDALMPIVQSVIESNPAVVAEYKSGKVTAVQFLVGQAMKVSKGSANPKVLLELFKKTLS